MCCQKFLYQITVVVLALLLLVGCNMPTTKLAPSTTYPPPTLSFPPTAAQPPQPTGKTTFFNFLQTVQVTPDDEYLGGAFVRINYLPATDHFVVTFGGPLAQPPSDCGLGKGFSYKEYTLDMQATGKTGIFSCDPFDAGSVMADNIYYFAAMANVSGQDGWRLLKIDATNWQILADAFLPLDVKKRTNADPMVAYANGTLYVSAGYYESEAPPPMNEGAATHLQIFSPDLQHLDEKILADTPQFTGSSLIYLDGIYYFVTANAFARDVVVIRYDKDWKYLGVKTLIKQAHWSTGLAYDGQRFYVAYMDTSQRSSPGFLPVHLNVHLAAFDRDWNLLEDVAVTNFAPSDNRQPGRPWVIPHNNRLYVSYDVDTIDPTTQQEQLKWQAYVSVYELSAQTEQPVQPTTQPGAASQPDQCDGNGLASLGVLRSTDHGATWTSIGEACMQNTTVWAVDPTGFSLDNQVVLYFVDFGHLNQPVTQSIYRATSSDGINFDTPQAVYTQTATMVDPSVLPMADGSIRLYVPSEKEGIIVASSRDGLAFSRENAPGIAYGGMPGGLLLPDGQVRMFLNGAKDGQGGIFSMISSDGLNFSDESGMRLMPPADNLIMDNAQPIHLASGGYLMLYQLHDVKNADHPTPWTFTEIHLATSADGLNWTPNPKIIGYGGTSCIVEMPDGTLYIYYVNR